MPTVSVQIVRFTDPAQPGWVACVLRDASGRAWEFVEKVPVVTTASLDEYSVYPQPGVIACEIIRQRTDEHGRTLYIIDTEYPWHVAATSGEMQFEVSADQITTAAA